MVLNFVRVAYTARHEHCFTFTYEMYEIKINIISFPQKIEEL